MTEGEGERGRGAEGQRGRGAEGQREREKERGEEGSRHTYTHTEQNKLYKVVGTHTQTHTCPL